LVSPDARTLRYTASVPEIAWQQPVRLRNRIIHGYWSMDLQVLHTARQQAIRAHAEARAATDPDIADRHTCLATSAEALQKVCGQIEASLADAMDDRRAWEQLTAGPRRLAVAADSELRRRHPDQHIEPLRSAEPRPPEGADQITATPVEETKVGESPEWVTQLAEQRRAFQDKLAERQNVMVPAEDPDYDYLGQAWPWQQPDPGAILQPPKPEIRPFSGTERLDGREIPDLEAGS
jgi:ribonuclease HepT-like protein